MYNKFQTVSDTKTVMVRYCVILPFFFLLLSWNGATRPVNGFSFYFFESEKEMGSYREVGDMEGGQSIRPSEFVKGRIE